MSITQQNNSKITEKLVFFDFKSCSLSELDKRIKDVVQSSRAELEKQIKESSGIGSLQGKKAQMILDMADHKISYKSKQVFYEHFQKKSGFSVSMVKETMFSFLENGISSLFPKKRNQSTLSANVGEMEQPSKKVKKKEVMIRNLDNQEFFAKIKLAIEGNRIQLEGLKAIGGSTPEVRKASMLLEMANDDIINYSSRTAFYNEYALRCSISSMESILDKFLTTGISSLREYQKDYTGTLFAKFFQRNQPSIASNPDLQNLQVLPNETSVETSVYFLNPNETSVYFPVPTPEILPFTEILFTEEQQTVPQTTVGQSDASDLLRKTTNDEPLDDYDLLVAGMDFKTMDGLVDTSTLQTLEDEQKILEEFWSS